MPSKSDIREAAEHVIAVTDQHLTNIYNGKGVSSRDGIKHIKAALVLARAVIPEVCGSETLADAIGGPLTLKCTKEPHVTGMHYDAKKGRRFQ